MSANKADLDRVGAFMEALLRGDPMPSVRDGSALEVLASIAAIAGHEDPDRAALAALGNRALDLALRHLMHAMDAERKAILVVGAVKSS